MCEVDNMALIMTAPDGSSLDDDAIVGELREQIIKTRFAPQRVVLPPSYYEQMVKNIRREVVETGTFNVNLGPVTEYTVVGRKLTIKDRWLTGQVRHKWQMPIVRAVRWVMNNDPQLIILQSVAAAVLLYLFIIVMHVLAA